MNKVSVFQFMRKLEKLIALRDKADDLEKELSAKLTEHLGEGWFIHNVHDDAVEYIQDFAFN